MREVDDFAKLDTTRSHRTGIPEVVLAEGKRDDHLQGIVKDLVEAGERVIVSRLTPDRAHLLEDLHVPGESTYREDAHLWTHEPPATEPPVTGGRVGILAAGTSDHQVAAEARVVAEHMGCSVRSALDVGVAGIHRLLPELEWVPEVDAVIVAAGREGALAPVVAGLVDVPVVGLPVGTGYGAGGEGEAALLTMLQSCAPMTVVNIDAGVVAGACAARIANRTAEARGTPRDPGPEVEPEATSHAR